MQHQYSETFIRELASDIVSEVKDKGTLEGLVGVKVTRIPMSLQRLADHGVPPSLDLPYDSDELRALVQELAQIEVD